MSTWRFKDSLVLVQNRVRTVYAMVRQCSRMGMEEGKVMAIPAALWVSICTLTMMTSSNVDLFRVTGHLCGEFTSSHTGQWRGALMFSLICAWTNGWVNNRNADDLRRHRAHNDVIVMTLYVYDRLFIWVTIRTFFDIYRILSMPDAL